MPCTPVFLVYFDSLNTVGTVVRVFLPPITACSGDPSLGSSACQGLPLRPFYQSPVHTTKACIHNKLSLSLQSVSAELCTISGAR